MKFYWGRLGVFSIGMLLLLASNLMAHKPFFTEGQGNSIDQAIPIENVDISQVFYREVTAEAPELWLTFEGQQDQNLFLQLGVPVIDRLENYRPAVALIGPGLPTENVPLGVPEGLGAQVFTTEGVTEPTFFNEPFTGTDSWILGEWDITLPQTGQYYILAYDPAGQPGKLWVSVGRTESFGLSDLLTFGDVKREVREFHEVDSSTAPCCLLPIGFIVFLGNSLIGLSLIKPFPAAGAASGWSDHAGP
jgi:hypothetical protein